MWILNLASVFCLCILTMMLIRLFLSKKSEKEISKFNFNMILFILNVITFIVSGFSSFLSVFGLGMGFAGMLIWFPIHIKLIYIPKESCLDFKELFTFFMSKNRSIK